MTCPFCSHSKCRSCLDVSVNVLACCVCRGRAIRRLEHLKEIYRLGEAQDEQITPMDSSIEDTAHAGNTMGSRSRLY
jgi:hypothetical protein